MSTILRRPAPSLVKKRKSPVRSGKPSLEYGWRLARRKGLDGQTKWERIPLSLQDALHPQFGDVQTRRKGLASSLREALIAGFREFCMGRGRRCINQVDAPV
jgi:hypothetical protein